MEKFKVSINNDDEYGPSIVTAVKVFETSFGIGFIIETDRKVCEFRVEITEKGKTYADGVVIEVCDRYDEDRSTEVVILPNVPGACMDFEGKWFVNNFQGRIEAVVVKESEVIKEFLPQTEEKNEPDASGNQSQKDFSGRFYVFQSENVDGKYVENKVSSALSVEISQKRLLEDSFDEDSSDDHLLDFYYSRIQSVYDEKLGLKADDENEFLTWARAVLSNKTNEEI